MKKVVGYCRVSTDKEDQRNSFENQKDYFQRKLSRENGFELVEIFADPGLSATKFYNRKGFNKMMEMAGLDIDIVNGKYVYTANKYKKSYFQYIYVTNSSRFARNMEVVSIIRALKDKEVYVVFEDLNKSTEEPNDEMILNFMFALDEQESRSKSSKVINGHKRSAIRTDKIHTNSKLYGYKLIKESNSLEIIEEEASVIRFIFDLYIKGYGQRRIINELNKRNILTRNGREFGTSTINNILRNVKYCGISNRLAYSAPRLFQTEKISRNSDEQIVFKESDRIPVIISKEVFDKVTELREKKVFKGRGVYEGTNKYINKIKCEQCGANYSSNIDRGRRFYNCSKKKTKGTNFCNNKNISESKLDSIVEGYRKNFYIYICREFEKIKILMNKKISIYNEAINLKDTSKEKIDVINIIEELKSKKDKLLDLYLDGKFDKEVLNKKSEDIEEKINKYTIKLDNIENGINEESIIRDELIKIRNQLEKQVKNSKCISKVKFIDIIESISINDEEVKVTTTLEKLIEEAKSFINV